HMRCDGQRHDERFSVPNAYRWRDDVSKHALDLRDVRHRGVMRDTNGPNCWKRCLKLLRRECREASRRSLRGRPVQNIPFSLADSGGMGWPTSQSSTMRPASKRKM